LQDRGLLKPGMAADMVIFDPNTVIDRATWENPCQFPVGIEQVVVNGQVAVRDGQLTGALVGQVLRRSTG
jgi:N-acyl-D-amino-acid deacylase